MRDVIYTFSQPFYAAFDVKPIVISSEDRFDPYLTNLPGFTSDVRRIRHRCSSRTATLRDDAGGPHTEAAIASRSCRSDIAGAGGGSPDASSLLYRKDDD